MTLIKVQLAAGCVMWVLCFIYILIYVITTIRFYRAKRPATVSPLNKSPYPILPAVATGALSAPPVNNYLPPIAVPRTSPRPILITCPTCSAGMNMTTTKRAPM